MVVSMNTPRSSKRRYEWRPDVGNVPDGPFVSGLSNPEYASWFASVLTEFEHLESYMPRVLAVLLGTSDDAPAGYVYRALRNPSIRYNVLRDLLEKAPHNKKRSEQYDDILAKYNVVRKGRNDYAHGLWFTQVDTKAVYLARRDDHGYAFFDAKAEPLDALKTLRAQIGELLSSLFVVVEADRRQLAQEKKVVPKP
jgi:hypothetical protein